MSATRVCLVVGAGDATGGAVARRFARGGFTVAVVRRGLEKLKALVAEICEEGGAAVAFACDARVEEQVVKLVADVEASVGPIEVLVHNIGANVRFPISDTTARKYFKVWEMAAMSAFLTSREVSARMVERGRGTIILTGATASIRGSAGYAAFSGAMHARRALAQSLAAELSPKGIHVAHVVVDGPIDTAFVRHLLGEAMYEQRAAEGSLLLPRDIADAYWHLAQQPCSAWTLELDLRPWNESIAHSKL